MSSLWQSRFTEREKRELEEWWNDRLGAAMSRDDWPGRWPKMEQHLPRRKERLRKKYGR